jgi:hypothetical protein
MKLIRSIFAVVTLLITALFAVAQIRAANSPSWGNVKGDRINAGTSLRVNDSLLSPNKQYLAIFQSDGNFVVYRTSDMHYLWATSTENRGANLCTLQSDGNLVVYRTWEAPNGYWDSQDDGTGQWNSVWVETDGTHTEYQCLWHAGTNGYSGNWLVMQNDSNLVLYTQDGRGLWNTGIRDQPVPTTSSIVPLWYAFGYDEKDHFYSTNRDEIGAAVSALNYVDRGEACYVESGPAPGTVPLYRYVRKEGLLHFYTTNYSELGEGAYGYEKEGIQCYVYSSPVNSVNFWDRRNLVPLYRYRTVSGSHIYTTTPMDQSQFGSQPVYETIYWWNNAKLDFDRETKLIGYQGYYTYEGVVGYVYTNRFGF